MSRYSCTRFTIQSKKKKKDDGANICAILEKTSWPKEERGEKVRKK